MGELPNTTKIRAAITKPALVAAALTEAQLAERWNISQKTLQSWRDKGIGPKFLKLGKAIRYPQIEVEAFEAANLAASTSARMA